LGEHGVGYYSDVPAAALAAAAARRLSSALSPGAEILQHEAKAVGELRALQAHRDSGEMYKNPARASELQQLFAFCSSRMSQHWVMVELHVLLHDCYKLDFEFAAAAAHMGRAVALMEALYPQPHKELQKRCELLGDVRAGASGVDPRLFLGTAALSFHVRQSAVEARILSRPKRPADLAAQLRGAARGVAGAGVLTGLGAGAGDKKGAIAAYQKSLEMLHVLLGCADSDANLGREHKAEMDCLKGKLTGASQV
jgi:hypothetical protein